MTWRAISPGGKKTADSRADHFVAVNKMVSRISPGRASPVDIGKWTVHEVAIKHLRGGDQAARFASNANQKNGL